MSFTDTSTYPRGFIVVVDCIHTVDMVDIADVVGTWDVIGLAGCNVGAPIAGSVAVQEAQREQGEVGFVPQVDKAQVGVVGLG